MALLLPYILQRASSSQASNLTTPDLTEVLSKGQMWVDERMENRRIINKILPCTLCPCKMGSGFQVGFSQQWLRDAERCMLLFCTWETSPQGLAHPQLSASSWCYRSASLHALHKPQAPSFLHNSHLCWFFARVFLPAVTGSLQTISLSYQLHISSLPEDSMGQAPPTLKEIGQETQEEIQGRTHINDL